MPELQIGTYNFADVPVAIDANRLLQRHALICGRTGSGKSWLVSGLLDRISEFPQVSPILFDVTGEYGTLAGEAFRHLRVAGAGDIGTESGLEDGTLYVPYWTLDREILTSLLVSHSETAAANQFMLLRRYILQGKRKHLARNGGDDYIRDLTSDSPFPFDLHELREKIRSLNEERVRGARGTKQGEFHGKLGRLLERLSSRMEDRELGFLFQPPRECRSMGWLSDLMRHLIVGRRSKGTRKGGVTIIDYSEVPVHAQHLVVGTLTRLIFQMARWTRPDERRLVPLFVEEAHNVMPEPSHARARGAVSLDIFERVAKEGRKYGLCLMAITQDPSHLNPAVRSQTSNIFAFRLTQPADQMVVRQLLPDDAGLAEMLPALDDGKALVVGDATIMPTLASIAAPRYKPRSRAPEISADGGLNGPEFDVGKAVEAMRRQSFR